MKIQKKQEIEFFGTKTGNANSIALGYATETKNFGEVAVGIMNKSTAAKDPNSPKGVCVDSDATLFSVGYGGSGERKNALEVKGDGSVMVSGENGDINVADKIKQALDADASIKLVRSAENSLQYTLMVNDEPRGSIDIPKDQFLKNVTYDFEGKQLVFTFVTLDEDEHVEKVPVGDLKDIYKAGDGITIDGDNVISADFSSVMTAISDEKTQRETTDNEIKSTLDTKADTSAIPTKVSQLANDYGYIRQHGIAYFSFIGKHSNTASDTTTYLTTEDVSDREANKVFAADGSLFDASKLVKKVQCNVSGDTNNIEFGYTTVDDTYKFAVVPTVTKDHGGIMSPADKVKLDGIQDLIDAKANKDDVLQIDHSSDDSIDRVTFGNFNIISNKVTKDTILSFGEEYLGRTDFAKINALPSITGKLSNITAATTTEDMITKFNDLLADLKAKGYMAADVTA